MFWSFSSGNGFSANGSLQIQVKQDALCETVVETVAADSQRGWILLAKIDGHPRVA